MKHGIGALAAIILCLVGAALWGVGQVNNPADLSAYATSASVAAAVEAASNGAVAYTVSEVQAFSNLVAVLSEANTFTQPQLVSGLSAAWSLTNGNQFARLEWYDANRYPSLVMGWNDGGGFQTSRMWYASLVWTFQDTVKADAFNEGGTTLGSKYLGIAATATNSDKLGNVAAADWATDAEVTTACDNTSNGVMAKVAADYSPKTLALPWRATVTILPTNEIPWSSSLMIPPEDIDRYVNKAFAKSWCSATDATSVWHFCECASNVVPNTAWVTNQTIAATNTGTLAAEAWTIEAGNVVYVVMETGSDNNSSNVSLTIYGTNLWSQ